MRIGSDVEKQQQYEKKLYDTIDAKRKINQVNINEICCRTILTMTRVRSSCPEKTSALRGEEVCPVRTGGSSEADVCTFWCHFFEFFEIYRMSGCPHGQGGGSWVSRIFCEQGERKSILRDFVRTSFMDGAPNGVVLASRSCFDRTVNVMPFTRNCLIRFYSPKCLFRVRQLRRRSTLGVHSPT